MTNELAIHHIFYGYFSTSLLPCSPSASAIFPYREGEGDSRHNAINDNPRYGLSVNMESRMFCNYWNPFFMPNYSTGDCALGRVLIRADTQDDKEAAAAETN